MSAAVQTEKPHHLAAFERYLGLGPARSFKAVAEHLGRTETTVQRWARSFDWRGRVQAHDRAEARAAAPELPQRRAAADSPHHALVKGATVQFARRLAAGDVPVRLADLERLIKLDRWLNGEGTDGPDAAPARHRTRRVGALAARRVVGCVRDRSRGGQRARRTRRTAPGARSGGAHPAAHGGRSGATRAGGRLTDALSSRLRSGEEPLAQRRGFSSYWRRGWEEKRLPGVRILRTTAQVERRGRRSLGEGRLARRP